MDTGLVAGAVAAAWGLYHYATTRDIRRTLHRIADAVENVEDELAANPAQQHSHVDTGDQDQGQPPS